MLLAIHIICPESLFFTPYIVSPLSPLSFYLALSSLPGSNCHLILGVGFPSASQKNVTILPSETCTDFGGDTITGEKIDLPLLPFSPFCPFARCCLGLLWFQLAFEDLQVPCLLSVPLFHWVQLAQPSHDHLFLLFVQVNTLLYG